MKWIMSQDKTCLIAPESGVAITIQSYERTGSPTLHGTYYSLVAQAIGASDGAQDLVLGTYVEKKDAQEELERIFKAENPVAIM